jgi:hypothetical protein
VKKPWEGRMLRSLDPALTVNCCDRVDLKKKEKEKGGKKRTIGRKERIEITKR